MCITKIFESITAYSHDKAKVLLTRMGWLFIVSALFYVIGFLLSYIIVLDLPTDNLLPAVILVAIGTQLFVQAKNIGDTNEKRSLFYLESCVLAYKEANDLLRDGNNNRVKWIAAGRALEHATTLATGVKENAHCHVLELHQLKYRLIFHDAIDNKTASFFYGAPDPLIHVDEAAKWSTAREGQTYSTIKYLNERSIRAVWKAAQWPTDYQDPLEDQKFSEEERENFVDRFSGLYEYLNHKADYDSASGKLYRK